MVPRPLLRAETPRLVSSMDESDSPCSHAKDTAEKPAVVRPFTYKDRADSPCFISVSSD